MRPRETRSAFSEATTPSWPSALHAAAASSPRPAQAEEAVPRRHGLDYAQNVVRAALLARVARILAAGLAVAATWSTATGSAAEPPAGATPAERQHQAGPSTDEELASKPPRPELPEGMEPPPPPEWERRLDIGLGPAYVTRPLFHERAPSAIGYDPRVGIDIHLRWDVVSFLRFKPYYYWTQHDLTFPRGALGTSANGLSPGAVLPSVRADSFAFGAQLEPTWWLNERLRVWLAAGVGWGRIYVPDMEVDDPQRGLVPVPNRSMVFVEFPLGLGVAVDVIERWLALELELRAAPHTGRSGEALETVQAVDAAGQLVDIGPLDAPDVTFVQTLGLALIL